MHKQFQVSPDAPLDWRDYVSIFLVSATLIVFQIALTRILSVVAWYHFAFLTISMVMLGLGAPGVWFSFSKRPQRWLPWMLLASGILVPTTAVLLLEFGPAAREISVLLLIALVLPAMLALGAVVCLLLMRAQGAQISRLYGVDLIGACVGAVLIIPLLHTVPTPSLVAGAGLLPLAALALHAGKTRWLAGVAAIAIVAILPTDLLSVKRSKVYDEREMKPLFEKWSPTARIAIFDFSSTLFSRQRGGFTWGRGVGVPATRVNELWLEQDGSAGTPITEFAGDYSTIEHLLFDVTTLGYQVRQRDKVAIIGSGGGRDILSAKLTHATHIDAVDLNPHTIQAVSETYGDFSGHVYDLPGVHKHAAEGRNFISRASGGYDLIQISLIDSWAASAAGAFALAENNLYTIEAFESYFDKLSDTGVLSTSRWFHEMPRLVMLARDALSKRGIKEPERHLIVAFGSRIGTVLLSKRPFEEADFTRLQETCVKRGFNPIYPPDEVGTNPDLRAYTLGDFSKLRAIGVNTRSPTDDSPYFFQAVSPFSRASEKEARDADAAGMPFNMESTKLLRDTMLWVSALAVAMFFAPFVKRLLAKRSGSSDSSGREIGRASLYFAAIGAGFMLQESMLLQRFVLYLGHPSYATTVILASLLLGMGIGSTISPRFGLDRLRRYGFVAAIVLVAMVAITRPLFDATLSWPIEVRIGLSLAMLAPLGGLLGLFFPLGMLRFGDAEKPWFWAINGAFGVVASVLSLALSMQFGFTTVGYASAVMYIVAWLCLGRATAATRVSTT
ncbi:MAG: hypothetical protein SGI72_13515 [Planctomycetota bacterium]|nr:hypothetical protein [Planctomycetota bacterium]